MRRISVFLIPICAAVLIAPAVSAQTYQNPTYPGSTYPGSTYPGSTYPGSTYPGSGTQSPRYGGTGGSGLLGGTGHRLGSNSGRPDAGRDDREIARDPIDRRDTESNDWSRDPYRRNDSRELETDTDDGTSRSFPSFFRQTLGE